jgi:hypothetical protein
MDISFLLEENVKQALNDPQVAQDMKIILEEFSKATATGGQNPAAGSLKSAFNETASLLNTFAEVLQNKVQKGKLEIGALKGAKILKDKNKYEQNGAALAQAFVNGDAAAAEVAKAVNSNPTLQEAFNRVIAKSQDRLFRLEQTAGGQYFAIERATSQDFRIPLTKETYEAASKTLAAARGGNNPQGPSV